LLAPARLVATCEGDCDGDARVTVEELVRLVALAVGRPGAVACPNVAGGCAAGVTCVDTIVLAVAHALQGCPAEPTLTATPSNTPTATPTASEVPSETPTSTSATTPTDTVPPTATATSVPLPNVIYDRTNRRDLVPFPDDFFLVADAVTRTGSRVSIPPPAMPPDSLVVVNALLAETNRLDGFSPIAHFVVELMAAPDGASLPHTPAESLDPLASVGLFDVTPGSPTRGQRVPFMLQARSDPNVRDVVSHTLLVFPSIPLTPGGRYGLVVTRRVRAIDGRPFAPSPFFAAALGPPQAGEAPEVQRVRTLAAGVLAVLAEAQPPVSADEVALVTSISVRSTEDIPRDLVAIKDQVLAAPPPSVTVTEVVPEANAGSAVEAIVRGTWTAPDWREDDTYFLRDASGLPEQADTQSIPFILALPRAALDGPVPLTMYQHGNPGSAENEVPSSARRYLASAGFAVAGFTDVLNREVSAGADDPIEAIATQTTEVFFNLLQFRDVPDYWAETNAEQLAFVRMMQGLGTLDVLPVGAPDGRPEIDVNLPFTYVGISQGANHGQAFVPYVPEVRAAALVVGGARLGEVLIHQVPGTLIEELGAFFPNLTTADIWTGVSLFQTIYDVQDAHNHASFVYRDPVSVAGTTRKPSILVIEGLDDSLVPNHATDSLAWALGPLPHLAPVQRVVPFLEVRSGTLAGTIDVDTTAAFFQYVPVGVPGIDATPGCAVLGETEGHYCAQRAAESLRQRTVFFQSAVREAVPRIIDPFAE
jgi:hypothetical protein